MPVLLGTHAFLWWCADSPELSAKARRAIRDHDCFVSYASFWEIAIKVSLSKMGLPEPIEKYLPEQMAANGFEQLEISFRHIVRVGGMPWAHKDPFDRLLVAQAKGEGLSIVSRDPVFDNYGVTRIW